MEKLILIGKFGIQMLFKALNQLVEVYLWLNHSCSKRCALFTRKINIRRQVCSFKPLSKLQSSYYLMRNICGSFDYIFCSTGEKIQEHRRQFIAPVSPGRTLVSFILFKTFDLIMLWRYPMWRCSSYQCWYDASSAGANTNLKMLFDVQRSCNTHILFQIYMMLISKAKYYDFWNKYML